MVETVSLLAVEAAIKRKEQKAFSLTWFTMQLVGALLKEMAR